MSTFKGLVAEFPEIRVDFFRQLHGFSPPLACFLSHVHSDHLAGLDTFDGCFIYCSAATKEILLRLEKASARLNYAKGILEDPRLQTYRHLEKMLKPIPLDTPTTISLFPGHDICVTLLDANHCVGAVMFLFEGLGKAVLYTGDTRCEPRLVTAISQNPNMVEYSIGAKTLDRVYLDTSILDDYPLQTKADGLRELLEKLRRYPEDTIFHFRAWTYGYEEVWIALSKALGSKIHVDDYKMRVFESLVTKSKDNRWAVQTHLAKEAPALVGFTCGNRLHEGCLTRDEDVRIHSCERETGCSVMDGNHKSIVWICPIVTHLKDGRDMMEVGVGGGGDDLTQRTTLTPGDILEALQLMSAGNLLSTRLQPYVDMVKCALENGRDISLTADSEGQVDDVVPRLLKSLFRKLEAMRNPVKQGDETVTDTTLPRVVYFPYARHSSLPELRDFVSLFKPKDITPCTFDADYWLQRGWSIGGLFGDCCSGDKFDYDEMLDRRAESQAIGLTPEKEWDFRQKTGISSPKSSLSGPSDATAHAFGAAMSTSPFPTRESHKRDFDLFQGDRDLDGPPDLKGDSQTSELSDGTYAARKRAFNKAATNIGDESWEPIGLISTTDNHTYLEEEL